MFDEDYDRHRISEEIFGTRCARGFINADRTTGREPDQIRRTADIGFYMSEDIADSNCYGERLLISELQEPAWFLDPAAPMSHRQGHEQLMSLRAAVGAPALRALGISGILQSNNHVSQSWMFSIDQRATSSLREATVADFLSDAGLGRRQRDPATLDIIRRSYPFPADDPWLIEHYLDIGDTIRHRE